MRKLDHPNIVPYLGSEVNIREGILYIFQEWVPGGSVTSLLERFGPFATGMIRMYIKQVLEGLKYLHHHQIIHRDIKGGNILVDPKGPLVKLADFGASKQLGLNGSSDDLTTTLKGEHCMGHNTSSDG